MTKGPSRWIAALLGLLVPGSGHLYVGELRKAVTYLVAMIVAFPIAAYILLIVPPPASALLALIVTLGVQVVAAVSSWRAAARWPADRVGPAFTRWPIVIAAFVIVGVTFALVNRARKSVLVEAVAFPGTSMAPTIAPGDDIMIDKRPAARIPVRNAVMVLRSIEDPTLRIVKRVVAVAGDTIAMHTGTMTLNGQPVPEPGLSPLVRESGVDDSMALRIRKWQLPHLVGVADTGRYLPNLGDWGPMVVPADSIFLLGDNRNDSYDSRYFGFVPTENGVGTVLYIYLSRGAHGPIRWSRMGQKVH